MLRITVLRIRVEECWGMLRNVEDNCAGLGSVYSGEGWWRMIRSVTVVQALDKPSDSCDVPGVPITLPNHDPARLISRIFKEIYLKIYFKRFICGSLHLHLQPTAPRCHEARRWHQHLGSSREGAEAPLAVAASVAGGAISLAILWCC